jgi:hypothetical protein
MYTQYFWQDKNTVGRTKSYTVGRTKSYIIYTGQKYCWQDKTTHIYIGIYIIYIYRQDKNTVGRTKPHTYIYRFDQLRRGVVC